MSFFVQGAGRLGADPELRYLSGGTPIVKVRFASNNRAKVEGTWKDVPLWVNLVAFGPLAERLAQIAKKGSVIVVSGKLNVNEWETNGGEKRRDLEIYLSDFEFAPTFAGGKSKGQGQTDSEDDDSSF